MVGLQDDELEVSDKEYFLGKISLNLILVNSFNLRTKNVLLFILSNSLSQIDFKYLFKIHGNCKLLLDIYICLLSVMNISFIVSWTINSKSNTSPREAMSAEQRLVITIRILSSCDIQQPLFLCYSFRLGRSLISGIISETCSTIYDKLYEKYLRAPKSENEWLKFATCYKKKQQLLIVFAVMERRIRP